MNCCKDCKHWTAPEPPQQQHIPTHGVCHRIECDDHSLPAYVIDWEGTKAELRTRGDFSCVLHEAITPKDSGVRLCAPNNHSAGWYMGQRCTKCGDVD